jgi:hypothetical protein
MRTDPYIVLPAFSLEPNKICAFNRVFRKSKLKVDYENSINPDYVKPKKNHFEQQKNTIVRQAHNFTLSDNAHRTLKRKINWLYYLAKSKQIKTYSGKDIFNFKIAFITLTLPSKQKESTAQVTNVLFNQFLTEVRQRSGMQNYVWRLEFQKNGNVHYHLVTDTYLDYFFLQKIWNRILDKAGYVQEYSDKHKNMSLAQYNAAYNANGKQEFSVIAKRYALGCKNKWLQPNSVDVKSVISKKAISNYISKYFSKDSSGGTICNILDTPENSANLRLWFCSRSLSKLNSISEYSEAVDYDLFHILSGENKVKTYICRWAKVLYYEMFNLSEYARKIFEMLLKDYAKKENYCPA